MARWHDCDCMFVLRDCKMKCNCSRCCVCLWSLHWFSVWVFGGKTIGNVKIIKAVLKAVENVRRRVATFNDISYACFVYCLKRDYDRVVNFYDFLLHLKVIQLAQWRLSWMKAQRKASLSLRYESFAMNEIESFEMYHERWDAMIRKAREKYNRQTFSLWKMLLVFTFAGISWRLFFYSFSLKLFQLFIVQS